MDRLLGLDGMQEVLQRRFIDCALRDWDRVCRRHEANHRAMRRHGLLADRKQLREVLPGSGGWVDRLELWRRKVAL